MLILSWEELPEEERPPKRIWLDDERLNAFFQEVRRRRKQEASGERAPIEDPVQNEAARLLIAE